MATLRPIEVSIPRSLEREFKRWTPAEVELRTRKALVEAAIALEPPLRSASPVGPTGNLRGSIRPKILKGAPFAVIVGPAAPHAHLVIQGHRIVGHLPNKVDTGRRSRPNPFVDRVAESDKDVAVAAFVKELSRGKDG